MASKKNENRKTVVTGKLGFFAENRFEDFNVEIPYTRSVTIATDRVREIMNLDNKSVMIQVCELIQEEIKRTIYNPQLVFDNMTTDYESEEIAKNEYIKDAQTVIPYIMYEYEGQIWAINSEKEYITECVLDNSPLKFTKVEARAFLKMSGEELFNGYTVIGVHGDTRREIKRFAIVENEKLSLCVKEN